MTQKNDHLNSLDSIKNSYFLNAERMGDLLVELNKNQKIQSKDLLLEHLKGVVAFHNIFKGIMQSDYFFHGQYSDENKFLEELKVFDIQIYDNINDDFLEIQEKFDIFKEISQALLKEEDLSTINNIFLEMDKCNDESRKLTDQYILNLENLKKRILH